MPVTEGFSINKVEDPGRVPPLFYTFVADLSPSLIE